MARDLPGGGPTPRSRTSSQHGANGTQQIATLRAERDAALLEAANLRQQMSDVVQRAQRADSARMQAEAEIDSIRQSYRYTIGIIVFIGIVIAIVAYYRDDKMDVSESLPGNEPTQPIAAPTPTSAPPSSSKPFTITDMDFVNTDKNNNILGSYGRTFETARLRYLSPRITYNNLVSTSGDRILNIKIIKPDGSLMRTTSSPSEYTYNYTLNVRAGKKDDKIVLGGVGNNNGNSYSPGVYTCEIWSNGQRLHMKKFTVTGSESPPSLAGTIWVFDNGKVRQMYSFRANNHAIFSADGKDTPCTYTLQGNKLTISYKDKYGGSEEFIYSDNGKSFVSSSNPVIRYTRQH